MGCFLCIIFLANMLADFSGVPHYKRCPDGRDPPIQEMTRSPIQKDAPIQEMPLDRRCPDYKRFPDYNRCADYKRCPDQIDAPVTRDAPIARDNRLQEMPKSKSWVPAAVFVFFTKSSKRRFAKLILTTSGISRWFPQLFRSTTILLQLFMIFVVCVRQHILAWCVP